MPANIPADVMAAAVEVLRKFVHEPNKQKLTHLIARAILSERESATKAERERCALIASEGSFPIDISVWLESTKKEMTAITAEAIAAAIRKGDGE